jgi:cytoskeletal protein RodZ
LSIQLTRRRALLGTAVAAVAVLAVGCTSAENGAGNSAPTVRPVSTPAATPTSTPAPSSTAPSTPVSSPATSASSSASSTASSTPVSSPAATTPASSTPPPTTPAPPHGPASCGSDQLTATGLRGGAGQGVETAGVMFTNSSNSTCTVRGYPYARLRYRGHAVGNPATDEQGSVRTITLRPGKSAQSLLHAVTTCQAPVSDHAEVRTPVTSASKIVSMQLRACSLSIDPLEPA